MDFDAAAGGLEAGEHGLPRVAPAPAHRLHGIQEAGGECGGCHMPAGAVPVNVFLPLSQLIERVGALARATRAGQLGWCGTDERRGTRLVDIRWRRFVPQGSRRAHATFINEGALVLPAHHADESEAGPGEEGLVLDLGGAAMAR